MKSTIKIDVDGMTDKPIIKIRSVTSSDDLRDKSIGSLLRKLGFDYGQFYQEAVMKITYDAWGGGQDMWEDFTITPIENSSKYLTIAQTGDQNIQS